MKIFTLTALLPLFLCSMAIFQTAQAESAQLQILKQRTDGPIGSEYSDFSDEDGRFQLGAQFGALVPSTGRDSSFLLGFDVEYRPYDIFGLRATLHQGVQEPRGTTVSITPVVTGSFGNLQPYAFFGPGFAVTSLRKDNEFKFLLAGGIGGDIVLTDNVLFGLIYSYSEIFDVPNYHAISSRIAYRF